MFHIMNTNDDVLCFIVEEVRLDSVFNFLRMPWLWSLSYIAYISQAMK